MRVMFTQINTQLPLYLESIGMNWPQQIVVRPQGYPYYRWLQTTSGCGIIYLKQQQFLLPAGQGILLAPRVAHRYQPLSDHPWQTEYLTFGGQASTALLPNPLDDYLNFSSVQTPLLKFIEHNCATITNTSDPTALSVLVYRFLLNLRDALNYQHGFESINHLLVVKQFLEQHYQTTISNQLLAQQSGYSVQHLARQFKQYFGLTPLQYLTDIRLRQVKLLLVSQPQLTLEQVANQAGFASANYLIIRFHRAFGITPQQFRRLY